MTIIVCSQIRSGGTVTYQACAHFVENLGLGTRQGYYEPPYDVEENNDRWGVIKVSELSDSAYDLIKANKALGVFTHRDEEEAMSSAKLAFNLSEQQVEKWRARTDKHIHNVINLIEEKGNILVYPFPLIQKNFPKFITCLYVDLLSKIGIIDEAIEDLNLARQRARPKVYPLDLNTLLLPNHFRG